MNYTFAKMDATEMLQIRLDNANLRKDIVNIKGKISESSKEMSEVKFRHMFEMDELRLTYEDKIENLEKLNSNLQTNVDKYQNKVLALHELMKEKEELVVEMKRKMQDTQQSANEKKKDFEKKIQNLQNDMRGTQLENKNLKTQCQALEKSNSKIYDKLEKLELEHASCGEKTNGNSSPKRSDMMNSLEMSDHQLQTELNELHTLLKEKSRTIREIKKKRNGSLTQYNQDTDQKGYIQKINMLENEIKTIQTENDQLKKYCNEMELSKSKLTNRINALEKIKQDEEKHRKEVEKLNNLVKEKEDTITWIETKMLESFDSMAVKTNEYEEKINKMEDEMTKLLAENQELKLKNLGQCDTRGIVDCHENVEEILLKPVDVTSNLEVLSTRSNSINTTVTDAPSKLRGRGGLKRIFSKSFRKFVRDRGHVKDRGLTDDNEMFYVSEKD